MTASGSTGATSSDITDLDVVHDRLVALVRRRHGDAVNLGP